MRAIRALMVAGALGALALVGLAAPAGAAGAPPNDNPGGAKVIGSLPFNVVQSTKGATASDAERKLNQQCGAPAIRKGVWFKFTPSANLLLRASAEGTSYDVGLILATGPASSPTVINCGPLVLLQQVNKGTSYWILVFDAVPGSAGGTLRLQVTKGVPAPTVAMKVNPTGVAKPRTGAARISGTASCKGTGAQLVFLNAGVSQNVGQPNEAFGSVFLSLTVACGNTPITWQADAFPEPIFDPNDPSAPPVIHPFKPGSADVATFAVACNRDQCGQAEGSTTITLKLP